MPPISGLKINWQVMVGFTELSRDSILVMDDAVDLDGFAGNHDLPVYDLDSMPGDDPLISYLPDLEAEFSPAFSLQSTERRYTIDPTTDLKNELTQQNIAHRMDLEELRRLSEAVRLGIAEFAPLFAVCLDETAGKDRLTAKSVHKALTYIASQANAMFSRASVLLRFLIRRTDSFYQRQSGHRKCMVFFVWKSRWKTRDLTNAFSRYVGLTNEKTYALTFYQKWRLSLQMGYRWKLASNFAYALCLRKRNYNLTLFLVKWRFITELSKLRANLIRKPRLMVFWCRWIRATNRHLKTEIAQVRADYVELSAKPEKQSDLCIAADCFRGWRSIVYTRNRARLHTELKVRRLKALTLWRWRCVSSRLSGDISSKCVYHCVDCGSVLQMVLCCRNPESETITSSAAVLSEAGTQTECLITRSEPQNHDFSSQTEEECENQDQKLPEQIKEIVIPNGSLSESDCRVEKAFAILQNQHEQENSSTAPVSIVEFDVPNAVSNSACLTEKETECAELRRKLSLAVDMCSKLRHLVSNLSRKQDSKSEDKKPLASSLKTGLPFAENPMQQTAEKNQDSVSADYEDSRSDLSQLNNSVMKSYEDGTRKQELDDLSLATSSEASSSAFLRIASICKNLGARFCLDFPSPPSSSDVSSQNGFCEALEGILSEYDQSTSVPPQQVVSNFSTSSPFSIIPSSSLSPGFQLIPKQCHTASKASSPIPTALETTHSDELEPIFALKTTFPTIFNLDDNLSDIVNKVVDSVSKCQQLERDVDSWNYMLKQFIVDLSIIPADSESIQQTITKIRDGILASERFSSIKAPAYNDSSELQLLYDVFSEDHNRSQLLKGLDFLSQSNANPDFSSWLKKLCRLLDPEDYESSSELKLVSILCSNFSYRRLDHYFQIWRRLTQSRLSMRKLFSRSGMISSITLRSSLSAWIASVHYQKRLELAAGTRFLRSAFSRWRKVANGNICSQEHSRILSFCFSKWKSLVFGKDFPVEHMLHDLNSQWSNGIQTLKMAKDPGMDRSVFGNESCVQEPRNSVVNSVDISLSHSNFLQRPSSLLHNKPDPIIASSTTSISQLTNAYRNRESIVLSAAYGRFSYRLCLSRFWYKWRLSFVVSLNSSRQVPSLPQINFPAKHNQNDLRNIHVIVDLMAHKLSQIRSQSKFPQWFLRWRIAFLTRHLHCNRSIAKNIVLPIVSVQGTRNTLQGVFYVWRSRCLGSWLFEAQQLYLARSIMHRQQLALISWKLTSRWRQVQLLAISHFRRNSCFRQVRKAFVAWRQRFVVLCQRRISLSRSVRSIRFRHIRRAWRLLKSPYPICYNSLKDSKLQDGLLDTLLQKVKQLKMQIELNQIVADIKTVDPAKIFCQSVLN